MDFLWQVAGYIWTVFAIVFGLSLISLFVIKTIEGWKGL